MDLIDREALYKKISRMPSVEGCAVLDQEEVEAAVRRAPVIDAEPVVRCENCKHYRKWKTGDTLYFACMRVTAFDVRPSDFCSYGERKDKCE